MAEIENLQIAHQVVEIVPAIMRILSAELRRTKSPLVSPQIGVLTALAQGPRNVSELAEIQGVSLPTMSNTVHTMVQQGWVKRHSSEQDRRIVFIEITPEGREMLQEIGRLIILKISELLTPLTATDRAALSAGLDVLRRAFGPIGLGDWRLEIGDSEN